MYEYKAILKRVVDGDTMDVIIDMGFKMTNEQRIRLKGLDTPETWRQKKTSEEYQKGIKAKEFATKRFKENKNEFIIRTDKDPGVYGRYIAEIVFTDSKMTLNDELIHKGFAKSLTK